MYNFRNNELKRQISCQLPSFFKKVAFEFKIIKTITSAV